MGDMSMDPSGMMAMGSQTTTELNSSSHKEIFDPAILQTNLQRVDRIHAVMGIAAGSTAGILGLTGIMGFGMYGTEYSHCVSDVASALTPSTNNLIAQSVSWHCI